MSFDRGGYESQLDRSRRPLWGDSAVDAAAYEELPNTMLPVRRNDMVQILRDVARDRERPESESTASEVGYGPTGFASGPAQPRKGFAAGSVQPSGETAQPAMASLHSAVSTGSGAPAVPTASQHASDQPPPGQTLTVRILDSQSNLIAVTSVTLIGAWPDGLFIGDVASGAITWRGGESISVVVGTNFDAQHRPIGGMPLEKWVHQYAGAKFVLVAIESAGFDHGKNQSGGDNQPTANSGVPNEAGSKSDSRSAASVSTSAPATSDVNRSGGNGEETKDASYDNPGRTGSGQRAGGAEGKTHPDGRSDSQAGGPRSPGRSGDRAGHQRGSTLGKRDGSDQQVGFFWKPTKAGGGTGDVGSESGSVDGMAGGDHQGGTLGIPEGLGAKPRIPIPKEWAAAVSLAAILIQAEVQSVATELLAAVKVLGATAAKTTLCPLVRASLDRLAEQKLTKALKILGKEAKYAGKTVEELEQLVRVEAAEQLSKELEQRIAAGQKSAQISKATTSGSDESYARAALTEQQADIDAAKRVKELLSEETNAAKGAVAQSEKSKQAAREAQAAAKTKAPYKATPEQPAQQNASNRSAMEPEAEQLVLGAGEGTASKSIPQISAGTNREMLGQAIRYVQALNGTAAQRADLFGQLVQQISKLSGGSWSAVRSVGVDGSFIFAGTFGESLVVSPTGQLFRGSMATPGHFNVNPGGMFEPVYSALRAIGGSP